ncbi:GAF and ANTAR domain-containing protein [Nocardioides anomalus]|uniref:GAF and ANTAR domain-containing protein n=1 Tax=Nocardioides anomalus TaxID=2712223 RepID=A0A6G6WHQ6_9ACTN|nr:GAF and ANTAR domain-containing protein [Nocardioides anomalus]QIG44871.1 GAF and ANTAR domain-containing protein [Nocardioides anomalus]
MITTARLIEAFVDLADTLVADFDLVDFLQELTVHAAEASGADAVGIVLADHDGRLQFVASSNESGRALELYQLQAEEGPCLDCYRTATPVVNADLAEAQELWPHFAPRAASAGYRSVHAFPMRLRDEAIGALNLFGAEPLRFESEDIGVVQALADVATIALLQQRSLARAEALTEQLQGALNSRILIEQAKGAIAEREGISPSEAFELLRAQARAERRPLVELASEVLAR